MLNYVKPEKFILEEEKEDRGYLYVRYSVQPLERGYGVMIGNALRRILLSSIPSLAITGVKIKDVYHEYDAVKGAKEDVLQILLNVKQIQVKENVPIKAEPVVMTVQKKGAGIVKAKDIKCPLEVKIANPELKLATLNEDADFYMELFVEKGKGYLPVSEMDTSNDVQMLPVDGIFTPVVRVNFRTEDFRVGKKIDYDRLILEIWTKKSVDPTAALKDALNILIEHFEFLLNNLQGQKESQVVSEDDKKAEEKDMLSPTQTAKAASAFAERIITHALAKDLSARRYVNAFLNDEKLTNKVVDEIAPKYAGRKGGYTRIIKMEKRHGDDAEMAIFQLVKES
jgi:DNA-directed RNA polymerase subunit alpha